MEPIKCFFVEIIPYHFTWKLCVWDTTRAPCPNRTKPEYGHRVEVELGVSDGSPGYPAADDPRWPKACGCGAPLVYDIKDSGLVGNPHYRRVDNGSVIVSPLPAGAMYFSDDASSPKGPDGKSLVVVLPPDGHHWYVDGMASNCTVPCKCGKLYADHFRNQTEECKKFEPIDKGSHRCWVRHGTAPLIHVDKAGETCQAGAGSIQTSHWHGFLTKGLLQLGR